jgi:hypothetical protein
MLYYLTYLSIGGIIIENTGEGIVDKNVTVIPRPEQTDAEKIAQSIIPYPRDDSRARYLGLRASGFTIREALKLIGNAHSTLSAWRKDEEFVSLEARVPEFQKQLSLEFANLEFIRNYRLVLEKDFRVLQQSIYPQKKDGVLLPMSDQDQAYLLKMRSHYTPQQLQIISSLLSTDTGEQLDFTEFIIQAARTTSDRVTIEAKRIKVSNLPHVSDNGEESNG